MASRNAAVRVTGLNELVRDFGKMSAELKRDLQRELQAVAAPIAEEARSLASAGGFASSTVAGIRPRVRGGSALVEQRRRKTTGRHPEYGARQMRLVLLPALGRNQRLVLKRLEQMLDRLGQRNGF